MLRVDRVGMTANNVTYALLGDAMHYWDFFPTRPGWGLVPLWGFGDVVASAAEGVEVGSRVYGYFPSASHLVVRPGRVDARGFRDASEHRAVLPSPYNSYMVTTTDAAYDADREDLLILFRPLFFTSFMLADQLEDNAFFGARVLAMSSASSKTAYSTAFLLQGKGPELVGLTSPGNVEFTESLGCYDRVRGVRRGVGAAMPTRRPRTSTSPGTPSFAPACVRTSGISSCTTPSWASPTRSGGDAARQRDPRTSSSSHPTRCASAPASGAEGSSINGSPKRGTVRADSRGLGRRGRRTTGPEELREVWLEVLSGKSSPRVGSRRLAVAPPAHVVGIDDAGRRRARSRASSTPRARPRRKAGGGRALDVDHVVVEEQDPVGRHGEQLARPGRTAHGRA